MTNFLQQLINGVVLGSNYALIALGYTMVYGVLLLINFAHGDVYMFGAFMGYYAARFFQDLIRRVTEAATPSFLGYFVVHLIQGKNADEMSITGAVLIMAFSMIVCALLGMVIERFAYRPGRGGGRFALAFWLALLSAVIGHYLDGIQGLRIGTLAGF